MTQVLDLVLGEPVGLEHPVDEAALQDVALDLRGVDAVHAPLREKMSAHLSGSDDLHVSVPRAAQDAAEAACHLCPPPFENQKEVIFARG